MGLLDDAIRDHLELKRLRGADPGEVAREEHEALDAGPEDVPAVEDGGLAISLESPDPPAEHEGAPEDPTPAMDPVAPTVPRSPDGPPQPAPVLEGEDGGQETAELDMQTFMDEQEDPGPEPTEVTAGAGSAGSMPAEGVRSENPLEWEAPRESPGDIQADAGDHNRAVVDPGA